MQNRPQGRKTNVTGVGKPIGKTGSGLGTGPVGHGNGYSGRPSGSQPSGNNGHRSSGGGGSLLIKLIIGAVLLLGGGGFGLSTLLGGGSGGSADPNNGLIPSYTQYVAPTQNTSPATQKPSGGNSGSMSGFDLSSLFGGGLTGGSIGNTSTGWTTEANTSTLDTGVASGSRAKRTNILGNGQDKVTIMLYMCGSDLESRSGMGTADLQEMINAGLNDNVNLIVYTGGAKTWKNSSVSSSVNQVYKVEKGQIRRLVKDAGNAPMTNPKTLASFIQFCKTNYPANRNELILWNHGSGSIAGYGYDEKNPRAGSMTLPSISEALKSGGVSFDFIGFDACLMGTLENGLTLAPYADYLIASEETEPGIGWYYTNWLTALANNPSMPTIELGKKIVDDFVTACAQKCNGQKTTLSVVDLAELENTVPDKFKGFASNVSSLLSGDEYKTVANARSTSREFAVSSKVDQVDLVSLANNINTTESKALAKALLGAVKYNRTSSNMTNAYGISVYFPYQKVSTVDKAVACYNAIGLDSEYSRAIQQFASLEVSGQAVSGGNSSPLSTLLGNGSSGSSVPNDMIGDLLGSLLGGNFGGLGGLGSDNSSFFGRGINMDDAAEYLAANRFNADQLVWAQTADGYELRLSEDQWALVHDLNLNVYFDDGEGYIDLGLDNIFSFTDDGALRGTYDGTWLAINQQPVAYYHTETVGVGDDAVFSGRIPILLNGERAELIIVFDSSNPNGYVAGVQYVYKNNETDTIGKALSGLEKGDVIQFVCDYYGYDGSYKDSYTLGDPMVYDGNIQISNVYIDKTKASATYMFTDIYKQTYWTPVIP
ncbi:MAG: peptidase C11 [Clostridia bacterium]|nr:peptidase C11 [Clostridia bacterium]